MSNLLPNPSAARWLRVCRNRGYGSVAEYADSSPSTPYYVAAKSLGTDMLPITIVRAYYLDYIQNDDLATAVRDSLFRRICQYFPGGWMAEHPDVRCADNSRASVYARWLSDVEVGLDIQGTPTWIEPVWQRLKSLVPNVGWLPDSRDDRILLASFEKELVR